MHARLDLDGPAAPCAPVRPGTVGAPVRPTTGALDTLVVELFPGPVLVLAPDGTVLRANAAARALATRPPVGTDLHGCGLLLPGGAAAGDRNDAPQWTGAVGARRLHGWTDTPLPDGFLLVSGVDHTARDSAAHELRVAATTDELTGLPNRAALLAALREALAGNRPVTVLFCDLDGFKAVNDAAGHAVGDALLRSVARRLQQGVRRGDLVARLGGDEFVVVSPGLGSDDGTRLARRLVRNVAQPVVLPEGLFTVGVSIGLAVGRPGTPAEDVLALADGEMYREKTWRPGRTGAAAAAPVLLRR